PDFATNGYAGGYTAANRYAAAAWAWRAAIPAEDRRAGIWRRRASVLYQPYAAAPARTRGWLWLDPPADPLERPGRAAWPLCLGGARCGCQRRPCGRAEACARRRELTALLYG